MKKPLYFAFALACAPSALAQTPAPTTPPSAAQPAAPAPSGPAATPAPATSAPPEPAIGPAEPAPGEPAQVTTPVEPEPIVTEPVSPEPVVVTTTVAPAEAQPQGQAYVADGWLIGGAAWDLSVPLGSTQDFTGNVSASGFSLEARYIALGRLSFGAFTGVHYMTAKDETTTSEGPVTISGTQVRSISATPWLARAHFSLMDVRSAAAQGRPVPYVAMGFGGARVLRTLDMGISGFSKESWHWAMSPEIGVQLPLNRAVFYLSSRLNYFFASGDGPEQMYLNVTLGAGFY